MEVHQVLVLQLFECDNLLVVDNAPVQMLYQRLLLGSPMFSFETQTQNSSKFHLCFFQRPNVDTAVHTCICTSH